MTQPHRKYMIEVTVSPEGQVSFTLPSHMGEAVEPHPEEMVSTHPDFVPVAPYYRHVVKDMTRSRFSHYVPTSRALAVQHGTGLYFDPGKPTCPRGHWNLRVFSQQSTRMGDCLHCRASARLKLNFKQRVCKRKRPDRFQHNALLPDVVSKTFGELVTAAFRVAAEKGHIWVDRIDGGLGPIDIHLLNRNSSMFFENLTGLYTHSMTRSELALLSMYVFYGRLKEDIANHPDTAQAFHVMREALGEPTVSNAMLTFAESNMLPGYDTLKAQMDPENIPPTAYDGLVDENGVFHAPDMGQLGQVAEIAETTGTTGTTNGQTMAHNPAPPVPDPDNPASGMVTGAQVMAVLDLYGGKT